jgi:hypothetical protein
MQFFRQCNRSGFRITITKELRLFRLFRKIDLLDPLMRWPS